MCGAKNSVDDVQLLQQISDRSKPEVHHAPRVQEEPGLRELSMAIWQFRVGLVCPMHRKPDQGLVTIRSQDQHNGTVGSGGWPKEIRTPGHDSCKDALGMLTHQDRWGDHDLCVVLVSEVVPGGKMIHRPMVWYIVYCTLSPFNCKPTATDVLKPHADKRLKQQLGNLRSKSHGYALLNKGNAPSHFTIQYVFNFVM
jgi:hypothetical protein